MSYSTFSAPANDRYFEDYVPGSVYEFDPSSCRKEKSLNLPSAMTRRFSILIRSLPGIPDLEALSPADGTLRQSHATDVDHYISHVAGMVRPALMKYAAQTGTSGDALSLRVKILEAKRSQSKPDRGTVRSFMEVLNQNNEVVMSRSVLIIVRCRDKT